MKNKLLLAITVGIVLALCLITFYPYPKNPAFQLNEIIFNPNLWGSTPSNPDYQVTFFIENIGNANATNIYIKCEVQVWIDFAFRSLKAEASGFIPCLEPGQSVFCNYTLSDCDCENVAGHHYKSITIQCEEGVTYIWPYPK